MAKVKSFGTTFTVATKAVGQLTEINNGGAEANIIDITTHSSADNFREFVGGLRDGGEISLTGYFDGADTGQDHIRDNLGASAACVLTYPNSGGTVSFSAIIKSYNEGSPLDDSVSFNATLKITGKLTYA